MYLCLSWESHCFLLETCLVNISVFCCEGIYNNLITTFCISSLIYVCFDLWCLTGFLTRAIALWLFIYIVIEFSLSSILLPFMSLSNRLRNIDSCMASVSAIYLASHVDSAIVCDFLDNWKLYLIDFSCLWIIPNQHHKISLTLMENYIFEILNFHSLFLWDILMYI